MGYAVYSSSLWVYDTKQVSGYVIAAGAILGCCAGLLWSAQGAIMMSYPEEKNKGKYVAVFWGLFNIGGILGSLITLGLNLENRDGRVQTGTYVAFVVIMVLGIFITFSLLKPTKVVRKDGTFVSMQHSTTWQKELRGVLEVWKEWRMLALVCHTICEFFFCLCSHTETHITHPHTQTPFHCQIRCLLSLPPIGSTRTSST